MGNVWDFLVAKSRQKSPRVAKEREKGERKRKRESIAKCQGLRPRPEAKSQNLRQRSDRSDRLKIGFSPHSSSININIHTYKYMYIYVYIYMYTLN